MCGLVLVVSKLQNGFSVEQQTIFQTLLWLDTLRGEDSTGVALISNIGNVNIAKDAIQGTEFVGTKEYTDLHNQAWQDGWAMLGHNRKATKGSITDTNAHPFVAEDNIVLMHNGSFHMDHRTLKDTECDSEAIAHVLQRYEDPAEALRKVNAAYALIWYNVAGKTINVIRNSQRPLWYMETKDSHIFASENPFLQFVKDRHKLQLITGMFEIKEYHLISMTLGDNKETSITTKDIDCSYFKYNTSYESNINRYQGYHPYINEDTVYTNTCEVVQNHPPYIITSDKANKKIIRTRLPEYSKKIVERILSNKGKMAVFKDYMHVSNELKQGSKLKVIVDDMEEADDLPKTKDFLLIGKTLDNKYLHTSFYMHEDNFSNLMTSTNSGMFEIEVDGITWHRVDTSSKDIGNTTGIILVHGVNPTPLQMGETIYVN